MPEPHRGLEPTGAAEIYELAAERLLDAVLGAWRPGADFADQLGSIFAATAEFFEAEPELGYAIAVWPFAGEEEVLVCYQRWQRRYADLLRAAARQRADAQVHPPFFEPTLIAGIHWQISRRLLAEGPGGLDELSPSLVEFVLTCYFGSAGGRSRLFDAGSAVEMADRRRWR